MLLRIIYESRNLKYEFKIEILTGNIKEAWAHIKNTISSTDFKRVFKTFSALIKFILQFTFVSPPILSPPFLCLSLFFSLVRSHPPL